MVGPAVGGLAAAIAGDPSIVFWVCGAALLVSAVLVAWRLPERARLGGHVPAAVVPGERGPGNAPSSILNRLFLVAVVLNVVAYLAGGTYEVVWSLYMTSLGASVGVIGLSFFTFALPAMVLSPFTGRYVDRRGGYLALTLGLAGVAVCGLLYTLIPSVLWMILLGLVEGSAYAFAQPALYLLVSRASPAGRASTAQGIFGAAGTMGDDRGVAVRRGARTGGPAAPVRRDGVHGARRPGGGGGARRPAAVPGDAAVAPAGRGAAGRRGEGGGARAFRRARTRGRGAVTGAGWSHRRQVRRGLMSRRLSPMIE
jgi:hypothetical protein